MEGSGMKPGSGKDSTYVLEVDKWKFIVFTDLDRMDLTSFVSIGSARVFAHFGLRPSPWR